MRDMNDYGKGIRDARRILDAYQQGEHTSMEHEHARMDILEIIQSYRNMGMYDYTYYCAQLNNIDHGIGIIGMMTWTRDNPMSTSCIR